MQGDYEWFVEQFYKLYGIDLTKYKRPQMERRLASLRSKRGHADFYSYLDEVRKDSALLDELMDRLTINVSEFFRNESRWDELEREVLPDLIREGRIRAWSAACSTGQEPYTLLMILARMLPLDQIQLLATDIDQRALSVATAGIYDAQLLTSIPICERQRCFSLRYDGSEEISDQLRKRITFKQHDLLRDDFPRDMHLIVCRNVLIYFTEVAKDLLYRKFAAALAPGGVLFLGSTEQIFRPQSYGLYQIQPFCYKKE